MKATLPTRLNTFLTSLLGSLDQYDNLTTGPLAGKKSSGSRHDRPLRKDFSYYMRLLDDDTREIVGHLSDISSGGFKLDTQNPVPVNKEFRFMMNLPGEVSSKPFMVFSARSRWCKVDPIDPFTYNVGFQLTRVSPEDLNVFNRMMEKYGREYDRRTIDLRRSNKW